MDRAPLAGGKIPCHTGLGHAEPQRRSSAAVRRPLLLQCPPSGVWARCRPWETTTTRRSWVRQGTLQKAVRRGLGRPVGGGIPPSLLYHTPRLPELRRESRRVRLPRHACLPPQASWPQPPRHGERVQVAPPLNHPALIACIHLCVQASWPREPAASAWRAGCSARPPTPTCRPTAISCCCARR